MSMWYNKDNGGQFLQFLQFCRCIGISNSNSIRKKITNISGSNGGTCGLLNVHLVVVVIVLVIVLHLVIVVVIVVSGGSVVAAAVEDSISDKKLQTFPLT